MVVKCAAGVDYVQVDITAQACTRSFVLFLRFTAKFLDVCADKQTDIRLYSHADCNNSHCYRGKNVVKWSMLLREKT